MLGLLKKPTAKLFELTVPVTAGAAATVRVNPDAGYVVCYAAAPNEDKAREETITRLHMHRCVPNAGWKVRTLDHKTWSTYAKTRWPRSVQELPSQSDIETIISRGGFFFGPDPLTG